MNTRMHQIMEAGLEQLKTISLASVRRQMLANAVLDWRTTANRDEADMAFEASLLATQTITEEDVVESFYWNQDDPTHGVTIITADGEAIFVDRQGNVTRGMMD